MLSPTEPPPHANAGIRRSRTDPALHAADARPAAQLVMFLSARRQRPWPLFCLCAGCSTPPDAHGAGFGGGHPSGVLQCAGVWPASVTARAVTPAPSRGSQHFRPDSRYGNATGSTLSALSRRTTVQPQNACPSPPQAVRRRKRPTARLRSCIAAVVYLHSCAGLPSGPGKVGGGTHPLHPPAGPPHSAALRSPDRRGTAAKILDSKRDDQRTRNAPQLAAKRPGATDPAPTSPPAERFHLLHPRQYTTTRCAHSPRAGAQPHDADTRQRRPRRLGQAEVNATEFRARGFGRCRPLSDKKGFVAHKTGFMQHKPI